MMMQEAVAVASEPEQMARLREPALPVVWSSEEWLAYFRANAGQLLDVPWEIGAVI